jgi:phosphoribosyl 1,2-cyclic phosphodiesterase
MHVVVLASGSSGNATLVRNGSTAVVVDAGVSARQLTLRLAALGMTLADLDGILLTHEHGDHTCALKAALAKAPVPVFANTFTRQALEAGGTNAPWRIFETGSTFDVGTLRVRAFAVPHDAVDPVGFRIESAGRSFGILTDLGHATGTVFDALRDIDALLIETNHDTDLLARDAKRPWSIKQRITSRHGHLSNDAAAQVVATLGSPRLRTIVLAHLSRDCNTPDLAISAIQRALGSQSPNVAVHCASPDRPVSFEVH